MRMNLILLILSAAIFNGSAWAASVQLDSAAGSVQFHATGHPSALKIVGKGKGPEGQLYESSQGITGTARFDLTSLETGVSMRDHHMKEKYLETEKYPQAELTITELKFAQPLENGKSYAMDGIPFQGKLKLHGVEKTVSGTVHLEGDGQKTLSATTQFSIKLADYAIAIPTFAGITIADDVAVSIETHGKLGTP